ncbi:MAG: PAS domain S-box protein [Opitutales bacterium]
MSLPSVSVSVDAFNRLERGFLAVAGLLGLGALVLEGPTKLVAWFPLLTLCGWICLHALRRRNRPGQATAASNSVENAPARPAATTAHAAAPANGFDPATASPNARQFDHILRQNETLKKELKRLLDDKRSADNGSDRSFMILQGLNDGLWDWNVVTGACFYSKAFYRLLKCPADSFQPHFRELKARLHPVDAVGVMEAINGYFARARDEPFSCECRLRLGDGEFGWFQLRATADFNDRREAFRMAGTLTDITARKEAEAELVRQQHFLELLFSHLPVGIYAKSARPENFGEILSWNPACETIFGVMARETLGHKAKDLFEAACADGFETLDRNAVETRQAQRDRQFFFKRQDGQERRLSLVRLPVFDAREQPNLIVCMAEDVTPEWDAGNAVDQFRNMLDSAQDSIFIFKTEGLDFYYVNRGAAETLGHPRERLLQRSLLDVECGLTLEHFRDRVAQLHSGEKDRIGYEAIFMCRDGHSLPVEVNLQLLATEGGEERYFALARDISERKRMEADLRKSSQRDKRLNDQLAVANRDLEEAIERANELAKEAQLANRAKTEFLANVSHDIRTPLNGIIGFLPLLSKALKGQKEARYVKSINESASILRDLINDLLDLSKIEAGQLTLNVAPFNARNCIDEAAAAFQAIARDKGLEITCEFGVDFHASLLGDQRRLSQVLYNLLGNAVKFTDRGSVRIRAHTRPLENETRRTLEIEVIDSGPGIAREDHARLFEPFQQGASTLSKAHEGTGLGLCICRKLLNLMEGEITLTSELGQGATFRFSLPVQVQQTAFSTPSEETAEALDTQLGARAPLRILVVDDSLINRQVLVANLEEMGYEAEEAEGGAEAVSKAGEAAFDVIFMDIRMPGMDGFEASSQLRQLELLPGKPAPFIAALSADAARGHAARCQECGIDAYLTKPVEMARVDKLLREVHAWRNQGGPLPEDAFKPALPRAKDSCSSPGAG